MMEDLLTVTHKNNSPYIQLHRQPTRNDFGPVTEMANSVRFIFDDDCWEYDGKKAFLAIKFKYYEKLKAELAEVKK